MHLKELCTIPQRSLKIVTSITLTTKQWIRCRKIAATEMLSPLPPPLGLSCTDSNFALATANVETRMIGSSLAQLCRQQGQTAVFSRLWLLQMEEEAYPAFVEVSLFMSLCSDKEYCTRGTRWASGSWSSAQLKWCMLGLGHGCRSEG